MARAHISHKPDCNSLARRFSGALLLLAIAGLLVACGGGASEPGPGGGAATIACITGPASTVLTWDVATGAAGYRIYYGTAPGTYLQASGAGVNVGNVITTPVMGLSSGTTYYFAATAYDASNVESVFSNEVCKTIS